MLLDGLIGLGWRGLALAAGVTLIAMLLLHPFATRLGLLDVPTARKNHVRHTPTTGGIAMMLGLSAVFLTRFELNASLVSFLIAAWLLIVTGWLDDRYDLRWWTRLGIQTSAAFILIYAGGVRIEQIGPVFGFGDQALGILSVPLTVIATVGLINAINMIDGVDGLAGTLVLSSFVMMLAAAIYSGNIPLAQRSLTMIGALFAFLLFNFRFPWRRHAPAFMGNAGSALLGLAVAWGCFRLTQNPGHPVSPVLALWLAPVPVIDCWVLIIRRLKMGRSPFAADHNHIHHLMLDAGFGPLSICLGLSVFTLLCGLLIGQCLRWNLPEPLLLISYFVLTAFWYLLTSRRERAVTFFRAARFWKKKGSEHIF